VGGGLEKNFSFLNKEEDGRKILRPYTRFRERENSGMEEGFANQFVFFQRRKNRKISSNRKCGNVVNPDSSNFHAKACHEGFSKLRWETFLPTITVILDG